MIIKFCVWNNNKKKKSTKKYRVSRTALKSNKNENKFTTYITTEQTWDSSLLSNICPHRPLLKTNPPSFLHFVYFIKRSL